jgi:hypothetical protein
VKPSMVATTSRSVLGAHADNLDSCIALPSILDSDHRVTELRSTV